MPAFVFDVLQLNLHPQLNETKLNTHAGPCSCNDGYVSSLDRCSITDEDVRIFLDPSQNSPPGDLDP